ncbi:MAG: hypothetical protein RMK30_09210 [Anaerolineae bacterium]|nr:hypothetical protein [Anaerolineae bacterium]MDW8103041.1 hypothetical protein [Anaerolineae bacterium]
MPALILLLALAAHLVPGPRTIEDAYITYRYSRHLLLGLGPVFNPGERVLGITTPFYMLILSAVALPFGGPQAPFPTLAWLFNAFAGVLACAFIIRLGRKLKAEGVGSLAATLWAISPWNVTFSIGGMETSLYVLFLLASFTFYLEKRLMLTSLAGALALLTRPDALIFLIPLFSHGLYSLFKTREKAGAWLRAFALFFLLILPWIIFAFYYYGSVIPHSIKAKRLIYYIPREAALVRLVQHYSTPFMEHLIFGINWIGFGAFFYTFLSFLGISRTVRSFPRALPGLVYPWLYFAALAFFNPFIFRWYLSPPLPFYILSILLGARALLSDLKGKIFKREAKPLLVIALLPVLTTLREWTLYPDHGPNRPAPAMAFIGGELLYMEVAKRVKPLLKPSALLAAGDVGTLGYFTEARILDLAGLNSPQTLNYYPLPPSMYAISYAVPPDLVLDFCPDVVVIFEAYGRYSLLKDERFWEAYQLLEKLPSDLFGGDGLLVFVERNCCPVAPAF